MDRTRKRDGHTDGQTDGWTDSAITICLPKFLWGHKKKMLTPQKNCYIYSLHAGSIFMLLLSSAVRLFTKLTFFLKNYFKNTILVSNSLDPDKDQHHVCPDLAPNCLQMLSADDNQTDGQRR